MPDIEGGIRFFSAALLGAEMLGITQRLSRQTGLGANIHLMKSYSSMAIANGTFRLAHMDYGIVLVSNGAVTRLQVVDLKVEVPDESRANFSHPGVIVGVESGAYNNNGDIVGEQSDEIVFRARLTHPPRGVKTGEDRVKASLYHSVQDGMVEAVAVNYGNPHLVFYTE